MSFPLAYSALRWENPNLEQTLVQLRELAGTVGKPVSHSIGSVLRVASLRSATLSVYRSLRFVVPMFHSM